MANATQTSEVKGGTPWKMIIPLVLIGLVVLVGVLVVLNLGAIGTAIGNVFTFIFEPSSRVNPADVIVCRADATCSTIQAFIFSLIVFLIVLTGFAYTTLLERVVLARLQHRSGPNRVGPFGLLQPAADGVKLIFKEDIIPAGAFRTVYLLAPILKAVPVLIVIAVVPWGPDIVVPWFNGLWYRVPLGLADPSVGVLWVLAVTSIGTYGVVLAGWASNNKYAMLGGLRATAQMLSYELSLGLTMAVPILISSSMSIGDIIANQRYIWEWYIFQNPLAAGILFIALMAEINRAPFDLPEAEQELTAGFMTEYSGMKFAAFMMAEYLGMIGIAIIYASLYLGGFQDGFGLVQSLPILGPLVLIGKVVLILLLFIWIRATLPRIRYDRLMTFGWKVLIPLSLLAVAWSAVAVTIADTTSSPLVYALVAGAFFTAVVVGGYLLVGRAEKPEGAQEEEVDPMITGERTGLGQVILQVVGGLIGIPFRLYDFTLTQLDNLAALRDKPKSTDEPPQ